MSAAMSASKSDSIIESQPLRIARVDARSESATAVLEALREKLSPRGDIVSPRGRQLTERVFGSPLTPTQVVETICRDIDTSGTPALLRYSEALDQSKLTADELRVPASELAAAHAAADPALLASLRRIRDNIETFQRAIRHAEVSIKPQPGVILGQRYAPLRRVGVCVPGGAAAYPSTVLMTVVPAQVAGVEQIAVVAPPTPFGSYNQVMLATCHELGVTEVYRMGGAQAVAALAYGCDAVPAVDKIVGPGNLFVALAKKYVYGTVDIDSIAGPSEVIVLADSTARPDYVAADLLSQAEHSPGSAILITWHADLIEAVYQEMVKQVARLDRGELTVDSLEAFSALVCVEDEGQAVELTDRFAPEHLHIQTAHPRQLAAQIRNAGATFLGHYTPVALGDYAAGPSHVLPTGGTARWAAGLSCNDFLRSSSLIEFDAEAIAAIAPDVLRLTAEEGLTAHGHSVSIRLPE
ncbi:histidinol dehydrogenase [Planctomycetaceae bacterium SH139]